MSSQNSILNVIRFKECERIMSNLKIKHQINTEAIIAWNMGGVCLGRFMSIDDLYFYLLGYDSARIDRFMFDKMQQQEKE